MCHGNLTDENSVLTCIHVLSGQRKYEYVEEQKDQDGNINGVESFTCSECLDLNEKDEEQVMMFLRCVCKECFVENRIGVING